MSNIFLHIHKQEASGDISWHGRSLQQWQPVITPVCKQTQQFTIINLWLITSIARGRLARLSNLMHWIIFSSARYRRHTRLVPVGAISILMLTPPPRSHSRPAPGRGAPQQKCQTNPETEMMSGTKNSFIDGAAPSGTVCLETQCPQHISSSASKSPEKLL